MSTSPNNDEKIGELLNFSGFPFQHCCAEMISKLDQYELAVEVPFAWPPSNGPVLGGHGTIDILAARPDQTGEVLLCFSIECKKANDKIKNWILVYRGNGYLLLIGSESQKHPPKTFRLAALAKQCVRTYEYLTGARRMLTFAS